MVFPLKRAELLYKAAGLSAALGGVSYLLNDKSWPDKEEERTVRFDELGNPRKPYAQVVANR